MSSCQRRGQRRGQTQDCNHLRWIQSLSFDGGLEFVKLSNGVTILQVESRS